MTNIDKDTDRGRLAHRLRRSTIIYQFRIVHGHGLASLRRSARSPKHDSDQQAQATRLSAQIFECVSFLCALLQVRKAQSVRTPKDEMYDYRAY